MSEKCLKCNGTGITVEGTKCDCQASMEVKIPIVLDIPLQYQDIQFEPDLVPMNMPREYGITLDDILEVIKTKGSYPSNLLICSPPNTGKTVFAYTIFRYQYLRGLKVLQLIDLIEAREILMSNGFDEDSQLNKSRLVEAPIVVIKIPLDLPNKFAETISTIIERRVRRGGITIFLYGNSSRNLLAQDKYGTLKSLIRDGSYNSVKLIEYRMREENSDGTQD